MLNLDRLKLSLYHRALGRALPAGESPLPLRTSELVYFLYRKGFWQYLRGLRRGHLLRACKGRLFIGKNVELWFPRYISAGWNVSIGEYSYVNGLSKCGLRFADNVRIREYAWIQATSVLQHLGEGVEIGENSYIGPHCLLGGAGSIKIGANVMLGAYVDVLAENHEFRRPDIAMANQGVTRKGITIGDDVWIGNKALILDGVTVGQGAVIGAGAVVTRDIPPYAIAVGNPAHVIGCRKVPGESSRPTQAVLT